MAEKAETLLDPGVVLAWDDTAMSGTAKRVTPWLDLGPRIKELSWVLTWANTAAVIGAFAVEVTNDDPDSSPVIATLPSALVVATAVNNNDGPGVVEATTRARYARLVYVNSSGTGTLSNAKAFAKIQ